MYNKNIFKQPVNISMNLGSQSISNESQTFNDYRYQKALKEISKLINVNRQIKIESENCKNQFQDITNKNSQLLQINSSLQNQNQMLRNELQALTINYTQLEEYCKKMEYEQKQLLKQNEVQSKQKLQIEQKHHAEIEELEDHFREQMNTIMMEIHTRDDTINELQQKLQYINQLEAENDKLHKTYEITLKQVTDQNRKIQQLNQTIINTSFRIKQQPNQDLVNKMRINQEWIKSLNEENYTLKQKVIEEEYKKERERCNQTILRNVRDTASLMSVSPANANQFLIKEYQKQVQKKIKKLEEEKLKVQHKYIKLKTKYQELQNKSISFQKQVNLLTVKLSGYEQLAERQQKELQQMVQEYHREMDKVISNKKKTIPSSQITPDFNHANQGNPPTLLQKELKGLVQNLEREIQQNRAQAQEKDKLIKFLQTKIEALQNQRTQIHKVNSQLEQQVSENQNMDLSKTSKNYKKAQSLLKNQSATKNGGKVFSLNGKKYENHFMKNKSSVHSRDEQDDLHGEALDRVPHEIKEQKKMIFPQGEISYTSSQRNYGNQWQLVNGQKA